MIHVALIASLVVGGLRTSVARPDSAPGNVSTASNPDTLVTTPAGAVPIHGTPASVGTGAPSTDAPPGADMPPVAAPGDVVGPRALPMGFTHAVSDLGEEGSGPADTTPHRVTRPRAIEYSDWYYRRLTMHRIGSYVEFPLFAAEYVLGERLLQDQQQLGFVPQGQHSDTHRVPPGLLTAHTLVAGGLGVLFGFNTITGGWNLWQSRKEPVGRTRRIVHTVLMLAADAGFVATAAAAGGAKHSLSNADTHRGLAEASAAVAGAGTIMMWVWNH
jgi:hypothetical protein